MFYNKIFEMCLDISGRTLPTFSWTATYISSRGQFSFNFYTTIIFGEILEHYYLETFKKTWLKIFCYQKQYRHSLRTAGDSLKEHNSPHPILLNCYHLFLHYECLNILIIRHALCQTYVCMVLERTSYKL